MPQAPTPNLGLVKPTENGDTGVWASLLDAMFDLLDAHDHSPGRGVKVPLGTGTTISGDVPWSSGGSFFAITNLKAVDFQAQTTAAVAAYAGALFMNSANNELTWRNASGTNVQLTNGGTLNISGVGGFGGDYIGVGALADYTDSSDTYAFRQQIGNAVRQYARVAHADLDLFEYKAQPAAGVPVNRVRFKSPASLAASYDLTWLAALPGVIQILQVDAAGQITASNTITQTLGATTVASLTSGAAIFNGSVTANTGITVATNFNIQLSGTANYRHSGIRTISDSVKLSTMNAQAGTPAFTPGQPGVTLTNNSIVYIPLPSMPFQQRLSSVSVWFASAADASACTSTLYTTSSSTPPSTAFVSTGITLTTGGTSIASATSVNQTLVSSQTFWVQVSNSISTPRVMAVTVGYDIP